MKITKVNYGKTYSLGNYCSERIDLEASIDETQESVTDAVFQLREYCDQLHKKNNPQLYTEAPVYTEKEKLYIQDYELKKHPFKTQPHSTIEAINTCTTLKVLQEFHLIVQNMSKKYPEISEAYQQKLKELTA